MTTVSCVPLNSHTRCDFKFLVAAKHVSTAIYQIRQLRTIDAGQGLSIASGSDEHIHVDQLGLVHARSQGNGYITLRAYQSLYSAYICDVYSASTYTNRALLR